MVAYFNRGKAFAAKGEYDHAIDDYTKSLDIKPRDSKAYLYRGIAHEKIGNIEEALTDFNASIEIFSMDAEAYLERGLTFGKTMNYDGAIADFTAALKIKPKNPNAYIYRGRAWFHKGDFVRAIDDYSEALDLNPNFSEAFKEIADFLANISDGSCRTNSQALTFARKIKKNRSKSCKLKTLISAYTKAGRLKDAQDLEEKIALLEEEDENEEQKEKISDEEIARLMAELKDELNSDDTTEEQKKDIIENIIELNKEIGARHPTGVIPECWAGCEFRYLEKYCRIQKATGLSPARLAKLLCL
jgi:tetratricopeptide (TPR) repeat protein